MYENMQNVIPMSFKRRMTGSDCEAPKRLWAVTSNQYLVSSSIIARGMLTLPASWICSNSLWVPFSLITNRVVNNRVWCWGSSFILRIASYLLTEMLKEVRRCVSCPLSHEQSMKCELLDVSQVMLAGLSGGPLRWEEEDRIEKSKPWSSF